MLKDDALVDALVDDFESAGLAAADVAMLRYAAKVTRAPASAERSDIDQLRRLGFGDEDILAIVEVTAYYAYANRIADGLGIELEDSSR